MKPEVESKLAELRKQFGPLRIVETDLDGAEVAAFRVPESAAWSRFRIEHDSGPAAKVAAIRVLVFANAVYPEKEVFESMVASRPGLVETYYGEVMEHAGANRAKKVRDL